MRVQGKWWLAVIMVVALLTMAGCGSAPSKAPESKSPATTPSAPSATPAAPAAPSTPVPEKLTPVTIAPGPIGGVLWLSEMVAEGTGAFKQQGIELTTMQTTGGNDAAKALMGGQADFALLALDHVLKNRAQGADLVVVAFLTKDPGLIMIVQSDMKGKVTSIKDLKGQKIGVSSLGGGTHMAVLSLLKQAGMQPTDVEVVAAKEKLTDMWKNKEIAAAMHVDPQVAELISNGSAFVLHDFRKPKDTIALYGTEYPLGTLVTTQKNIDTKPQLVEKMVAAILNANQYISTHSAAEITAQVPAQYKPNPATYEQIVTENLPGLAPKGTVAQDSIETVLRELRANQAIPADANVDLSKAVNLTFVNKLVK